MEPDNAIALEQLALCRSGNRSAADLLSQFDLAIEQRPADAEAHNNRGVALRELGRLDEALSSFNRALDLNPEAIGALVNRAHVMSSLGKPQDALGDYLRAIRRVPDFPPAGQGIIECLLATGGTPLVSESEFDSLLVRAIRLAWTKPQRIAPMLIARLMRRPAVSAAVDRVMAAWPQRLSLAECLGGAPSGLLDDDILLALLDSALIPHVGLERMLASLRGCLLRRCIDTDGPASMCGEELRFYCSLARHCFYNEYVYEVTGAERGELARLAAKLDQALEADLPVPGDWLVAVACYAPLGQLRGGDRLLGRPMPSPLEDVLRQQLIEPEHERDLRAAMPRLTSIRDEVSLQVRAQYEESPYPRWRTVPRPTYRETLASYIRRRVPAAAQVRIADRDRIDALNAGCGTGQHPTEMAMRIAGIQILAVDLSLSSLCHAKRMAQECGVANIEFAQADILELGAIHRRFDLIESSGVLHHLADPERGIYVLRGLLRPGGVMRLSLYSEFARRGVVAARALISGRGYQPTPEGIRSCRAELMGLDDDDPRKQALAFPDFYAMSECRDLLFHVQERRFTLLDIAGLVARTDLEFLGLELEPDQIAGFRRRFPDHQTLADLAAWHDFEAANPDTFSGMYTFWLRLDGGSVPAAPSVGG